MAVSIQVHRIVIDTKLAGLLGPTAKLHVEVAFLVEDEVRQETRAVLSDQ